MRHQLEGSGLKVFFDYEAPPHIADRRKFAWNDQRCARRNSEYALLDFSPFDVVFGHFPVTRYQRPNYRYVALLREPAERAISQVRYQVHRYRSGLIRDPGFARELERLIAGEVPVSTWVRRCGLDGLYRRYLAGWSADRFLLRGDLSRYPRFLEQLGDLLEVSFDASVRLNVSPQDAFAISAEEVARVREVMAEETDYYRQFLAGD